MRVKCAGGVSLKNRRRSVDFYSLEVMISNVLLLTCLRPMWRGVAKGGGLDIHSVVNYSMGVGFCRNVV